MDSANAASAASSKKGSALLPRVLSALVLIPLTLVCVYWSRWLVVLLVLLASVVALRELYDMVAHAGYRPLPGAGMAIGLGLVLAVAGAPYAAPVNLVQLALTLAVVVSLVAALPLSRDRGILPGWGLTFAGAIYFCWLASHFILLRDLGDAPLAGPLAGLRIPRGAGWIFLICAITWLQDSAAYFVGRAFGRHKMAPLLSPKKSWEGFAGGAVMSVLAGVLFAWVFGLPLSPWLAALLGLIAAVVGPLGDLAESLIKRQAGTKDAGSIIPGHGGVLDRGDSLIFIGAVLYYIILLLPAR